MVQDLNLVPESEVQEQQKVKLVKLSTILALLLLVVVGAVAGFMVYNTNLMKEKIVSLDKDINNLRSEITSLSEVEIKARNISQKINVLKMFFDERVAYSLFLEEVQVRKPGDLEVTDMDIKNGTASVSGQSLSYVSISNFINNLLDTNFEGGHNDLKSLFTSVSLSSVNLEHSTNKVKFLIVVDFDSSLLTYD